MEWLFIDFLNSEWHDWRGSGRSEDRLGSESWTRDFLETWGFPALGVPGPRDRNMLVSLREALREAARIRSGGQPLPQAVLRRLNAALAASGRRVLQPEEGGYRLEFVPKRVDWRWIAASVVDNFARFLREAEPERLKVCANTDCLWMFFDDTRNRNRRWCASTCGNLIKVRRFRGGRRSRPGARAT